MGAGFGLPLLILSCLATLILVMWARYGKGNRKKRIITASVFILLLLACWVALLNFGLFHPVGLWGMILGFAFSMLAFLVPFISNKLSDYGNS